MTGKAECAPRSARHLFRGVQIPENSSKSQEMLLALNCKGQVAVLLEESKQRVGNRIKGVLESQGQITKGFVPWAKKFELYLKKEKEPPKGRDSRTVSTEWCHV